MNAAALGGWFANLYDCTELVEDPHSHGRQRRFAGCWARSIGPLQPSARGHNFWPVSFSRLCLVNCIDNGKAA
jgi:hypothetical protein